MTPQTVNPYYAPFWNEMVFPAAILQPPFFHKAFHPAANFGAIGAIMGHELSHAFDIHGHKYDANGHQRNWWHKRARQQFHTRSALNVLRGKAVVQQEVWDDAKIPTVHWKPVRP